MMAKVSQFDRAIASLEADRKQQNAVIDAAIAKLKAQRDAVKPRAHGKKLREVQRPDDERSA